MRINNGGDDEDRPADDVGAASPRQLTRLGQSTVLDLALDFRYTLLQLVVFAQIYTYEHARTSTLTSTCCQNQPELS